MSSTMLGCLQLGGKSVPISRTLHAVMFEDINFAVDGGLYGEMIRNRSFEYPNGLYGWETMGDVEVRNGKEEGNSPYPRNPHYIRMTGTKKNGEWTLVENRGYRGIAIQENETYRIYVNARIVQGTGAPMHLFAEIVTADGTIASETKIEIDSHEWNGYHAEITVKETHEGARLRLILKKQEGAVDIAVISLFPLNTWKSRANGMRKDIAEAIADLKPGMFRFPGGCIVEGTTLNQRYKWKDTLGEAFNRPIQENRWSWLNEQRLTPGYYQSYGIGYYEYFQYCEDIQAEPLPVIHIGQACPFKNSEWTNETNVPLKGLGPYIQEALDLIEFANGGVESYWGGIRREMGHSEPFGLRYIELGNEHWGQDYIGRVKLFTKAIHAKHPEIKIVGGCGFGTEGADVEYLHKELKKNKVPFIDEHFYQEPEWFEKNTDHYDNYERGETKVMIGEYASRGKNGNTLYAALREAAFLLGVEKNADVVQMAAYAPLLAHYQAYQWENNLIWFDARNVVKTPNYWVQYLFGNYSGTKTISFKKEQGENPDLHLSASYREKDGEAVVFLKTVNLSGSSAPFAIQIPESIEGSKVKICGLYSTDLFAKNTLSKPTNVVPERMGSEICSHTLNIEQKPYSFYVITICMKQKD